MNAAVAPETAEPQIVTAATGLFMVMQAAELRGLPMPFAIRSCSAGELEVVLQFWTRDEVVTWAEHLGADDLDERVHEHPAGTNDTAEAHGVWLDVPIEVCCSIPRELS